MAIYYITYYQPEELKMMNLEIVPAGQDKSSYVLNKIDECGKPYYVISLAETGNKKGIYPKQNFNIGRKGQFVIWWGFGKPFRVFRKIHYFLRRTQLKKFLSRLNNTDTVIVYHSLATADIYAKFSNRRGFSLILELEEIYQDVVQCSKRKAFWEKKVIDCANGYILSTELLSKHISSQKPYVVVNGTYHVEKDIGIDKSKSTSIHVVYAGTFSQEKGAKAAIEAAKLLPENYYVHILGFGTDKETKMIMNQINDSKDKCKCILEYNGLLRGEEYIKFLQACDIGLATQNPNADFNDTSFPSKILSYMSNGLRVVTIRIPAIESSEIGKYMYYCDSSDPKQIAQAIQLVDLNDSYNGREILEKLDKKFYYGINDLLDTFYIE